MHGYGSRVTGNLYIIVSFLLGQTPPGSPYLHVLLLFCVACGIWPVDNGENEYVVYSLEPLTATWIYDPSAGKLDLMGSSLTSSPQQLDSKLDN